VIHVYINVLVKYIICSFLTLQRELEEHEKKNQKKKKTEVNKKKKSAIFCSPVFEELYTLSSAGAWFLYKRKKPSIHRRR
jgi:hypothetical protein